MKKSIRMLATILAVGSMFLGTVAPLADTGELTLAETTAQETVLAEETTAEQETEAAEVTEAAAEETEAPEAVTEAEEAAVEEAETPTAADSDGEAVDTDTGMPYEQAISLNRVTVSKETRAFAANIETVEFSNPELVWVGKTNEGSTVGALKETNDLECHI